LFFSEVFIEDRRSRILDERVFALHVIPREPERALRAREGRSARFARVIDSRAARVLPRFARGGSSAVR
jgi:hypothetical protein